MSTRFTRAASGGRDLPVFPVSTLVVAISSLRGLRLSSKQPLLVCFKVIRQHPSQDRGRYPVAVDYLAQHGFVDLELTGQPVLPDTRPPDLKLQVRIHGSSSGSQKADGFRKYSGLPANRVISRFGRARSNNC